MPLAKVIAERPDVFNHNVEVAPRLYPVARRGSTWERSLRVLENAKEMGGDEVVTKSGLMVGLGETHEEMVDAFGQLRAKGVQVLTVGQYLRPTERHLPVVRYWHPDEFKALETAAYELGFEHIAAGPLVRSSYHADEHVKQDRPGVGPVAATGLAPRLRRQRIASRAPGVPAQGQHPDRPLPGRHGRADRRSTSSSTSSSSTAISLGCPSGGDGGDWTSSTYAYIPCEITGEQCRARRRRGGAGQHWVTVFTAMFMHGSIAAPRRQHAVPLDLRQQRRGLHGPGEVRRLLPARRDRGDGAADGGRPGQPRSPTSAPRARSRPCSAATCCCSRAPA